MNWVVCRNNKLPDGLLQLGDMCVVRVTGKECLLLKRSKGAIWFPDTKGLQNTGWKNWKYRFYCVKTYYKLL